MGFHSLRFQCTLGLAKTLEGQQNIFKFWCTCCFQILLANTMIIYSNSHPVIFNEHYKFFTRNLFLEIKTGMCGSSNINNEFSTFLNYFFFPSPDVGLCPSGRLLEPSSSNCCSSWFSWFVFLTNRPSISPMTPLLSSSSNTDHMYVKVYVSLSWVCFQNYDDLWDSRYLKQDCFQMWFWKSTLSLFKPNQVRRLLGQLTCALHFIHKIPQWNHWPSSNVSEVRANVLNYITFGFFAKHCRRS